MSGEGECYYPFGLVMQGISGKALGIRENKNQKFQGQKFDDDLGLEFYQFKWRNHDPQIGRFIEVDPLSDKYVHNSSYAFSENKVTVHVELEGLEAWSIKGKDGSEQVIYGPFRNQEAAQDRYRKNSIIGVTEENKSSVSDVSWGETQGIYPTKSMKPSEKELQNPDEWDGTKTEQLMEARANIDFIYNERNSAAHTDKVNLNEKTEKTLAPYHSKDNFPSVAPEIKNDENAKYFYLSNKPDAKHTGISSKYWDQKIVKCYGPFYNRGGGDAPKGEIYIIFYSVEKKKK